MTLPELIADLQRQQDEQTAGASHFCFPPLTFRGQLLDQILVSKSGAVTLVTDTGETDEAEESYEERWGLPGANAL